MDTFPHKDCRPENDHPLYQNPLRRMECMVPTVTVTDCRSTSSL